MKYLFFATIIIIAASCSSIVDGAISESLEGNWEAFEIIDVPNNDTLRSNSFSFTLGGRACDAFRLFDDKSFNVYYQNGSSINGINTGIWSADFNDLTLDFDNGSSMTRTVTIEDDILTMPDTIFGIAKIVRFEKAL